MCGICGFISQAGLSEGSAIEQIHLMTNTLAHRGPDGDGYWLDGAVGVALGHRRLAIVELSAAGDQPMASASGRFELVFNGEIYNHLELRRAVGSGVNWRGHSDTESLLAAFEAFGIEETLRRSVGMFAFAVWDRQDERLTLARDRLGEKPLYYGWQSGMLLFGSELKALRAHRAFEDDIDQNALAAYLQYGYVPAPSSIYRGIHKLPPGCTWSYQRGDSTGNGGSREPQPYWSLTEAMAAGAQEPFNGSHEQAIDELERLLSSAIEGQLMADVPLGAFLSGGIDSSTVVALMQRLNGSPVKTFTIGFSEGEYDESKLARAVANHLGTEHTELLVTPAEALAVIPRLGTIYDEPLGDSSAIPTYLVAGLAHGSVKVALSGDGGDELFAGYERYGVYANVWATIQRAPLLARRVAQAGLGLIPAQAIERQLVNARLGANPYLFSGRVRSLSTTLAAPDVDALYQARMSNWPDPASLLKSHARPAQPWALRQATASTNATERMMAFDARAYLPDDVLVKVDRAAMAHSLETRAPLLDHRVVEFAWTLPHKLRVQGGSSKWLLRELLYRHVPRELVDRPKKGFSVPVDVWLRGPLKEWADELLSERALEHDGPFVAAPIRKLWSGHLAGANWHNRLWPVIAYQEWARTNR